MNQIPPGVESRLSLPPSEVEALYQHILSSRGTDGPVPGFEEAALDVPSEAMEAARFLVHVLLGE